jgi:aminoglycoside N3'-acetyltransferase
MRQCRRVPVRIDELRRAVRDGGLAGKPVCLHTSLRSFGPERPWAEHVIEAFLDEGSTVMAPTFSGQIFSVVPPPHLRPERNGTNYDDGAMNDAGRDRIFDPSTNDVGDSMGTLPRVLLRRPGRVRGNHPLSSFSAIGADATRLIALQQPSDVFAPLEALTRLSGFVVLIGVGLNRMTLIHLAEKRAGRALFRRWANGPDGSVLIVEMGGCSSGFEKLAPPLAQLRQTVQVRESTWQIYPAKSALNVATHAIRRDQRVTHCGEPCARCDDAVRGGPIL